MENIFVIAFLPYLIICIIVGIGGSGRQIGFMNSFLICVITTPIIGFIITVLSSKEKEPTQVYVNSDPEPGDYINELEKLHELKEKGILTQEEFEAEKKKVLGN